MKAGDFNIHLVHATNHTLPFNEHVTQYQRTNDVPSAVTAVDVVPNTEYFIHVHKVSASAIVDNDSSSDRILIRLFVNGESIRFRPIYKKHKINTYPDLIGLRTYKDGISIQKPLKFDSSAIGDITLHFHDAIFWDERIYQEELPAHAATNSIKDIFTTEETATIETKVPPTHHHYEPGPMLFTSTFQYSPIPQTNDNNTTATTNPKTYDCQKI